MDTTMNTAIESGKSFFDQLKDLANSDIFVAIVIAVGFVVVTAIVTHLVTKVLRKALSQENSPLPQSSIFINIWRVCAWGIGISLMLSICFGVDASGIVTALGVGGIAISLGLQDTISNLIGGVQMSIMGTVIPGDHIEVGGRKGIVRDVKWRQVSIETANGQVVIVPNSAINNGTLIKLPPAEKIIVPINLYKNIDDIDALLSRINEEIKAEVEKIVPVTKDPIAQLTATTDYAYTGSVFFWIDLTDRPYSTTLEALDIAIRVVAKLSPTI